MITVRELIDRAAVATDMTAANILGPSREVAICIVRCAIYRIAYDNGVSLSQIGRRAGRHHSSVMNALSQENVYRKINPQYDSLVKTLRDNDGQNYVFKRATAPVRVFWTDEEMVAIDLQMRAGAKIREIAEKMDRSDGGLRKARQKWRKRTNQTARFWTEERMQQVDSLLRKGYYLADIAETWGKTRDAIGSARRKWLQSKRDETQSHPL